MPGAFGFEADVPRFEAFEIFGLLDEFDYRIPLNVRDHVTAVIAPNGSGKTLCLRVINALFNRDWVYLENTVFKEAKFYFSDGACITASKSTKLSGGRPDDDNPFTMTIRLEAPNQVLVTWKQPIDRSQLNRRIERHLPFMVRAGEDLWIDRRDEERYNLRQLLFTFADLLPPQYVKTALTSETNAISDYLSAFSCKLIEAQRLIVLSDTDDEKYVARRERRPSHYAISKKSAGIKDIIAAAIARYAAMSQTLDRSFPNRVINSKDEDIYFRNVEDDLIDLDEKRKRLMDVGILDSENDLPVAMPEHPLQEALARVLRVYVEDNNRKLATLEPLYHRISLFRELIGARFGRKEVRISKEDGLDVSYNGRNIPIERLSSGEQHQLVLFFELLFETNEGSIILIDEPEISLHVAWQKKFIGDLLSIIKLNRFDVVLATHSPQLIGRWSNLVVELGDVYEGDIDDAEFWR